MTVKAACEAASEDQSLSGVAVATRPAGSTTNLAALPRRDYGCSGPGAHDLPQSHITISEGGMATGPLSSDIRPTLDTGRSPLGVIRDVVSMFTQRATGYHLMTEFHVSGTLTQIFHQRTQGESSCMLNV